MIDPVIFTIGNFSLRWYGVIVMIGVIVGSLIVERELKRRGGNGDQIWDALIWVLPIGILGARLWFVMNATLGGNRFYIDDPLTPIQVSLFGLIKPFTMMFPKFLMIWEGGLHIFGGFVFGAITLLVYLRKNNLDPWLFLDSAGPAVLIGQGIGRIANFINQELYGPPTTLPWGIPIDPGHRLPEFADLNIYPFETTRFHPTFAYEMLWNFSAAGLLLWLSRRYGKELKPGTLFAGWLILAGLGRTWIEFFRPDQPKIPDLGISYSAIFAALMAISGAVILMVRYKALNVSFAEEWEEEYRLTNLSPAQPALVVAEKSVIARKAVATRTKAKPKAVASRKPKAKTPVGKPKKTTTRTKKPASKS